MRRVLLGLALAVVALLACAAPSQAAPRSIDIPGVDADCKEAPTPQAPGRGLVGFFESEPEKLPPAGDPFAAGSSTSIYEQYGYAGLRWSTYDLGCGPDISRNPDSVVGTAVANWIVSLPVALVAATSAVLGEAFKPDFMSALDPLITRVVAGLRVTVFEKWFALPVALLGGLVIWRSRKQALASTAQAIGWALLVMVIVTAVFRWPLVAGHAADTSVTQVLGSVASGVDGGGDGHDAAASAAGGMHRSLLYESWLGGEFGRADSEVARTYGPVILDATSLTWREAALVESDPDAGKALLDEKKAKFEAAAEKIKTEDPDAYDYLTGKRSDARVGYALMALLATLCAVPFLLVAGLLVIGALLIVRFGVMLFPALATLGLFYPARGVVIDVAQTCAAALINAVIFGLGALTMVAAMGVLLDPATELAPWLAVVLMLVLTVVMWFALKPFRRLTQMFGRRTAFGDALHAPAETAATVGRRAVQAATVATGTAVGYLAAGRIETDSGGTAPPARAEVNTSYEPIPAPSSSPVTSSTEQASSVPSGQASRAAVPASPSPEPTPAAEGAAAPQARFEGGTDWDAAFQRELGPESEPSEEKQ